MKDRRARFEAALGDYWECAYTEGRTGVVRADLANDALRRAIQNAFPAPRPQVELTDAELSDPEYMRAYVTDMHESISEILQATPRWIGVHEALPETSETMFVIVKPKRKDGKLQTMFAWYWRPMAGEYPDYAAWYSDQIQDEVDVIAWCKLPPKPEIWK
jgi:hypothetical protein